MTKRIIQNRPHFAFIIISILPLHTNSDINDPVARNVLSKQACEELLQRAGLSNDTTLILYGDFNNWFAAFAFWVFKYYGYKDVRLMNGGRKKWLVEDRVMSKDIPQYSRGNFKPSDTVAMVDVRSRALRRGKLISLKEEDDEDIFLSII